MATEQVADLPASPTVAIASAAQLAARIQIPRRLPARYDGQPLQHLSHSSYNRFILCPEFCAPVGICGGLRSAVPYGAFGMVLWPCLVCVDLCGVVRVEPYGRRRGDCRDREGVRGVSGGAWDA
jgi:hypothetical protein